MALSQTVITLAVVALAALVGTAQASTVYATAMGGASKTTQDVADTLYHAQSKDVHMLAVSGIWIAFFAYLWANGLLACGFIHALPAVTGSTNTVIVSYWTALSILAILFTGGALWIAYSL